MRFEDHNQQHGSSADAGAILNLSTAKPRGLSAVWPRGGLGSGAAGGGVRLGLEQRRGRGSGRVDPAAHGPQAQALGEAAEESSTR
eukprot:SAG25_NODE_2162_length_1883_cov_8.877901_2_plen_86_part_00